MQLDRFFSIRNRLLTNNCFQFPKRYYSICRLHSHTVEADGDAPPRRGGRGRRGRRGRRGGRGGRRGGGGRGPAPGL